MVLEEEYFSTEVEASEAELDPIYKHVPHASIIEFLELGRLRFLESKGVPLSYWLEQELLLVVTKLQVQFRGELTKGRYQVLCFNPEIHSRKIIIGQGISSEDGQVMVEAQVELMFMDSKNRRVMIPPRRFIEAFLRVM